MSNSLMKSYMKDLGELANLQLSTEIFKHLLDAEKKGSFDSINWREQHNDLVILSRLIAPGMR